MQEGNREVQSELCNLLSSSDDRQTAALDGSAGNFFSRVRNSLRLAVKEIAERQSFLQTQQDARGQFEAMSEGLSGATIELLKADLHTPFQTRAHAELLLRLLKEMCEGHYEPMQVTLTLILALTHTHTLTLARTLALALALALTHTHTLTCAHTPTLTLRWARHPKTSA